MRGIMIVFAAFWAFAGPGAPVLAQGFLLKPATVPPATSPPAVPSVTDAELADACQSYLFIRTWKASYADKKDWPNKYLNRFDDRYSPLFAKARPADLDRVAQSYRTCLSGATAAARADPNYVITGQQFTFCDECSIFFSPLALQVPRMKLLEGLSYLMSPNLAGQDWQAAATTIRDANLALQTVQQDFLRQADAAYDAKGAFARKSANARSWGVVVGSVAGGLLTKDYARAADVAARDLGAIETNRQQSLSAIRDQQAELFDIPPTGELSDDGVRVTLPVFVPTAAIRECCTEGSIIEYAPFGAMEDHLPFAPIVKVLTPGGHCTGAFVGERLILTNRHCLFGADGAFAKPSQAVAAYYANGNRGIELKTLRYAVVDAIYPAGDHMVDRAHDWALLETGKASQQGWLGFRDPATIDMTDARVVVAGYSADLNEGSEITVDWGCRALLVRGVLRHQCRTWRGASGSPVVLVNHAGRRMTVIGVHAAGPIGRWQDGVRSAAASSELFEALAAARARHARQ